MNYNHEPDADDHALLFIIAIIGLALLLSSCGGGGDDHITVDVRPDYVVMPDGTIRPAVVVPRPVYQGM